MYIRSFTGTSRTRVLATMMHDNRGVGPDGLPPTAMLGKLCSRWVLKLLGMVAFECLSKPPLVGEVISYVCGGGAKHVDPLGTITNML